MAVSLYPARMYLIEATNDHVQMNWSEYEGSPRSGAGITVQRLADPPASAIRSNSQALSIVATLDGSYWTHVFALPVDEPIVPGSVSIDLYLSGTPGGTPDDTITDASVFCALSGNSTGSIAYLSGACTAVNTAHFLSCVAHWQTYNPSTAWTTVINLSIDTSGYTDAELVAGTLYYHRVRQYDTGGSGPWSETLETTTTGEKPPPSVDPDLGTIYRIYDGSAKTRTGTVTLNGTTAVVGSGTAFNTEFYVGDVIEVNGEVRRITAITDSVNLTVGTAFAQSASGQVYTGYHLVAVTSLATDMLEPNSTPQTYSAARALLDGTVRGLGWALTEWKWGFLTAAQHAAFKALCPGKSVATFVDTRDDADEFATYSAVMVWPERTEIYSHHWINFVLAFRKMIAV